MIDNLLHPLNEDALDTLDALAFTGHPTPEEIERLRYFMARWERRFKELEQLDEVDKHTVTVGDLRNLWPSPITNYPDGSFTISLPDEPDGRTS